jgi:phosphoribosylanthranilate isomerase
MKSMPLLIKVCGMRDPENIRQLAELQPDFIGFILHPGSKRFVGDDYTLTADIPREIKRVGVFVDALIEEVISWTNRLRLNFIQLHGNETPEYCKEIAIMGLKVIKSFGIDEAFDFNQLRPYVPWCTYFLFDTITPLHGGSGRQFNRNLLFKYQEKLSFFLSGGIGPDDARTLAESNIRSLFAVDINSRFETGPALKNIDQLKKFFSILRTKTIKTQSETMTKYEVDANGFYGEFGGAYIPEAMYSNIEELRLNYLDILNSDSFQKEFRQLLKDYAGRPSPLYFSGRLSEKYNTKVYLKREDLNHTGSHKINNTIGQILIAKRLGKTRIIAETGAGQHGVATATVCALMGIKCVVYMGAVDVERQAPNVLRMQMLGAKVVPVESGNKTLKDATNGALRDWINNPVNTHYIIGSVVGPHPYPDMVARLQSVISEEIRWQLKEQEGREEPDYILACVGGGSNAAGTFYHFLENEEVRLIGAEAAGKGIDTHETAATLATGSPGVLHSCRSMLMQNADGQITEPYSISAGLDYPGIGPLHAYLHKTGRAEYESITDKEALDAAFLLTRLEGIIPALESAHALAVLEKRKFRPEDVLVINISGRGDKDMQTYINVMKNEKLII